MRMPENEMPVLRIVQMPADTNAHGTASHGWTPDQSESFAEYCRRHGFTDATVGTHAGEPTLLSVIAHVPDSE